ncbi:SRPBCC family protein [Gottfriedia acidiceleris]|uniref:SRPBCC family protein n=1 Tax=Gottfriedia acidiceleris TaxID=371036 RepID=UPI00101C1733|nr:SRPBCC family protein [Gottfriedia acidiceleris]
MANTIVTMEIPANPEKVWQLIGGFNSLPDWLPYIPSSELLEGGRVRSLANPDGDTIVERLEAFNDKERFYTYSIMKAPFPVTNYQSTIRVQEHSDRNQSIVEWSGSFTPVEVTDEDVINLFNGIYKDGLEALRKAFQVLTV